MPSFHFRLKTMLLGVQRSTELWKRNMEAIHVRFLVYSTMLFQVRMLYRYSSELSYDK